MTVCMSVYEQEPELKKRSAPTTVAISSNKRTRVKGTTKSASKAVTRKGRSDDEDSNSDSDSDSECNYATAVTKSTSVPLTRRVLSSRAAKTKSRQSTKAVFAQVKDYTKCPRELIWQHVCRYLLCIYAMYIYAHNSNAL